MGDEAQRSPSLPLFPIQLRKFDIGELQYSCHGFSNPAVSPATQFNLTVAVSPFEEKERTLQVSLSFQCERPSDSPFPHPYSLRMTVYGEFAVAPDVERVGLKDSEAIHKWGEKNGALVLLPFLREAVFSFTQRTGFKPIMIPLVETKAFKVGTPTPRPDEPRLAAERPAAAPAPAIPQQ